MRIIYVAKFDQPHSNDDEGAIAYALTSLGHDVQCVREIVGHRAPRVQGDLVLFHHWDNITALQQFSCPKVFWYFDLIEYPQDPTLTARCNARKEWMSKTLPYVDLAFLTDGDYVDVINDDGINSNKANWLMQGADIRVTGPGDSSLNRCVTCNRIYSRSDILFTGISRGGGKKRISFVEEMKTKYGDSFLHIERRVHGRDLANLISNSRIVVAPDSPVTNRYWSNRVYLMLGFGAFLIHPYCAELANQYKNKEEILFYSNREELHWLIELALTSADTREATARAGYKRTIECHTYVHRCEQLINTVRERLKI